MLPVQVTLRDWLETYHVKATNKVGDCARRAMFRHGCQDSEFVAGIDLPCCFHPPLAESEIGVIVVEKPIVDETPSKGTIVAIDALEHAHGRENLIADRGVGGGIGR